MPEVNEAYDNLSDEVKSVIENALNQRTKVAALIETGLYTKADMSDILGMKSAGISSQMTYLRIAGRFTIYNEDRVYSFCSKEEFEEWDASRKSSVKAKAAAKTPQQQASTLQRTVKRLTTQTDNIAARLPALESAVEGSPDDQEVKDDLALSNAEYVVNTIRLKRAQRKLEELEIDEPVESDEVDEFVEVDESENEDLL